MVIVNSDMSTIYLGMKFFHSKTTAKHSLSIFVYLVSTFVKVLEVKVMGLLFCSSAAPKPYSLASVWVAMDVFYHNM